MDEEQQERMRGRGKGLGEGLAVPEGSKEFVNRGTGAEFTWLCTDVMKISGFWYHEGKAGQ